ncbi:hypothetical protein XPR_3863 [Xanthomonas arboricola pv. pruni MAFF 301420]|uniref:EamA domain-containing protein n=2 Tax=Xanthomonas arboricola pv. pruni TaxID=69929 RepID=W4SM24_9XANT|nr:integral membrane protein [Xanthomonas arboricola pv. pruni str. MAFF 311562]GAE57228.1 hypothetical protein XPR_3863 [Xanthomonas arboricola pv. pruni MAFF 301420]GAE61463.1 hypothetical protein XPN_3369 [Xanthomonas arboricola pv. pruni MAFF 301427]
MRERLMVGVACGIGAGALWGLVFLAPQLLAAFTPLQLTVARYLSYGAVAAWCWHRARARPLRGWGAPNGGRWCV